MTNFLALYRGPTLNDAKIICVSVDPRLTAYVASQMLAAEADFGQATDSDDVLKALTEGRKCALQIISESCPQNCEDCSG